MTDHFSEALRLLRSWVTLDYLEDHQRSFVVAGEKKALSVTLRRTRLDFTCQIAYAWPWKELMRSKSDPVAYEVMRMIEQVEQV